MKAMKTNLNFDKFIADKRLLNEVRIREIGKMKDALE